MLKILPDCAKIRVLAFILGLFQVGCATKLVAVGDWGRPSELNLQANSLEGIRIVVRCGNLTGDGEVKDRSLKICHTLEQQLKNLGAKILPATQSGADFTLWYLDRGLSDKRGSALSFAAFCFTFGIVPYISSSASEAELRVSDSRGVVLNRVPLRVESVKALGWSSMAIIFQHSTRKQQRELGRRFFRLVQNQMVSQALRVRPEKGEAL